MYDSDEVRDKVREETWKFWLTPGAKLVPLSAEELATIHEPWMTFGRAIAAAIAAGEAGDE